VTGGGVAVAALQRTTIAAVNVARVIAPCSYHFVIAAWRAKDAKSARMKYWQTTLAMLAVLSASLALAEDFKTIEGKEYKNVEVSRVEPDGIVLKTKSGISKVYFTELPKNVQERFHYNTEKAAQQRVQQQQPSAPVAAATPDVQKRVASQTTEQRENEEAIKQHHALIGMTAAQVRQAWGEPKRVIRTMDERHTYEEWIYGGSNSTASLYFVDGIFKSGTRDDGR
jgi:hypothetical protein